MEPIQEGNLKFEIYQELGECYTHTGDIKKAVEHFTEAAGIDPTSERPLVGLGIAVLQEHRYSEAHSYFNKALDLNRNSDKALCGIGMALAGIGDSEEALGMFRKALDIDPGNITALMGLVQSTYSLELLGIAEKYLKGYLALYPGNVKILYCLAGTCFKQRKYDECRKLLETIFIFEPEHHDARELLLQIDNNQKGCSYGHCQNS